MLRGCECVKNSNVLIILLLLCLSSIVCKAQTRHPPQYLDPSLPIEQRLDDLVPRLTLEEKIQVTQSFAAEVVPLLAQGVLRPTIDSKFKLADIRKAHERLESNETFGKVVLEFE